MQIPYRKPGKFTNLKPDPLLTEEKFLKLKQKLERLKNSQPQAAADVAQLAELGDFSENAEYQYAKARLRGINYGILSLESQINQAEIITVPKQMDAIQLGHQVTVEINGQKKIYQILGSSETNPQKGIISYNSPIGEALLGRSVGETVKIKLADKEVLYKIIRID